MFKTVYAMRVHQRSCMFRDQSVTKKRRHSRSFHVLPTECGAQYRLRSDANAFKGREPSDNSVPSVPLEVDNELMRDIVSTSEQHETQLAELDNKEPLVTSAMMLMARLSRKAGRAAVDEVLRLLIHPEFQMEKLKSMCQSVSDCLKVENDLVEKKLSGQGFQRVIVFDDDKSVQCDLYMRSPLEVLSKQIRGASRYTCLFNDPTDGIESGTYSHPMNSQLGTKGEKAVRNAIMSCKEENVMWHDNENSAESSFAGMVQLYSDKSSTSLKQSSFQFYPMHVTLLNFSEQYRRKCIVHGMSVVAFLPVKFFSNDNGSLIEKNLSRHHYLVMLRKCMEIVLSELNEFGFPGFECRDLEGTRRRCHPAIASYCCDLPECHDIVPVKNGNSSTRNCHRCNALTDQFNLNTASEKRNGMETTSLLKEAQKLRKTGKIRESDDLLNKYSLIDFLPFLAKFPFFGLDPVLDLHIIFSFEPLHNLFLGISRLLKSCLSERLRSLDFETSLIPTAAGKQRTVPFRTVRMTILMGVNKLLSHIQRYSPIPGSRVDFSKGGSSGHEKGLYGSEGKLIGMLEGKDYRNLEMVFPFVGAFLDRACDEVVTAVSTKLFVIYVEIVQESLSYTPDGSSTWNEIKVSALERKIEKFKDMARVHYSAFQPSKLCTQKFHMLNHIGEDIRRLGGLRYCDASLYEYAHTIVKNAHRSTSRRKNSAMDEMISVYTKDINENVLDGTRCNLSDMRSYDRSVDIQRQVPKAQGVARAQDCATLVKNGKPILLSEIERTRRLIRRKRIASENHQLSVIQELDEALQCVHRDARELVEDIGEVPTRMLCRELIKCTQRAQEPLGLIRVASGYVSSLPTPTMENYDSRKNTVTVNEGAVRKCQRFVSIRGFYGSPGLRQDCVALQASDVCRTGTTSLWFAKVLALFRTNPSSASNTGSTGLEEQMAFVQFFDVTPLEDEVERSLACIRLIWARGDLDNNDEINDADTGKANNEKGRKWFALLPVSTIRGVVQVVRGDYGIKNRGIGLEMEDISWEKQHFYVNRFQFETDSLERHIAESA